jgi:hypothetical protein
LGSDADAEKNEKNNTDRKGLGQGRRCRKKIKTGGAWPVMPMPKKMKKIIKTGRGLASDADAKKKSKKEKYRQGGAWPVTPMPKKIKKNQKEVPGQSRQWRKKSKNNKDRKGLGQ